MVCSVGAKRRSVVGDAGADGISPGHQCRARGSAHGRRRIPIREARAGRGQAVDVGRLQIGCAQAAQIVAAQIVGQEDDDIRRPAPCGDCHRDRGGSEQFPACQHAPTV